MRRFLDALYDAAGYLAALSLIGTLAFVLIGITGRIFNFHMRGTDAYAGYCMAGAGFLALAHTLKRGEHIRVTLLLQAVQGKAHKALELWSLGAAVLLAALLAWFSVRLAWQSWTFHDMSTSTDATPLWIPQISMALGTLILLVAFIDEFALEVRGERKPPDPGDEPLHNE
jgi:TRAP-type C4-dicarboxylate transport system permease small subunit